MPYYIKRDFWRFFRKGSVDRRAVSGWLNLEEIDQDTHALTDGAAIDIANAKNTLVTDEAAITFTISSPADDITLSLTLNTTDSVLTFPAGTLCVSEGVASGDNTCTLSGTSGDKYVIGIKKVGSTYYVASKNFGQ